MKKFATIALLSTLAFASAAQAQSAFVLVIGDRAEAPVRAPATALTTAERVEIAAEAACEKPFIRNLKGQRLYAACLEEARAEAYAQVAAQAAGATEVASLSLR